MRTTSRMKTALALLISAGTVFGAAAVSNVANALPANTAPRLAGGGLTLTNSSNGTSSGTFASNMALGFSTANQTCPGDNGTGWLYSPYLTAESSANVPRITFDVDGLPNTLTTGVLSSFLRNPAGEIAGAVFPSLVDPVATSETAFINGFTVNWNQTFGATPPAPGRYTVGVACFNASTVAANRTLRTDNLNLAPVGYTGATIVVPQRETARFWSAPVTVTATGYVAGWAPDAPVLNTSSYSAGTTTATVNFTPPPTPTPGLLDYTATLTPVGAATAIGPITGISATATLFNVPGVALGSSYTVTLRARNATGLSVASDPLTITGAVTGTIVVNAPDAFANTAFTVSWSPPTFPGGATPSGLTGYTLTGVGGSGITTSGVPASSSPVCAPVAPATLCTSVPAGLAIGNSYTATVTANYSSAGAAASGTDGFAITPNTLVIQKITVTRPQGALVLTQRCGVYGPLLAFTGVDSFPGFPVRPAPAAGVTSATPWTGTLIGPVQSADQVGTSPDADLATAGIQPAPDFAGYPDPNPAVYPTECALAMGSARLVTGGALAGQFYTATGRLNQVTVLDTTDLDKGWTARGAIANTFTGSTGDSFSGDYLGWEPAVTKTSDPILVGGYDQIVTKGDPVLPGSNVIVASQIGMTENPILASSLAAQGLGIASMDARMNLLIPATADAANYTANLSLTVVSRP